MAEIPLVSICVITYNQEDYLAETLDSLLAQECDFNFEIVIGEDKSSDKTRDICTEYQSRFPEVIRTIFRDRNVGMMANFRESLQACKGKYVAVCEGDDYWVDNQKLTKQVRLLEANPDCSMCVAKTRVVRNGETIHIYGEGTKDKYGFLDILNNTYFHTSSYLIRNEIVEKLLAVNSVLFQGDTSLRYIVSDMGPFIRLNEIVSVYRLTGDGVWSGIEDEKRLLQHIDLHTGFYKNFKAEYRKDFSRVLINEHYQLLMLSLKNKKSKLMIKSFAGLISGFFRNTKYFISFFRDIIGRRKDNRK